jgi:hypothetical protein
MAELEPLVASIDRLKPQIEILRQKMETKNERMEAIVDTVTKVIQGIMVTPFQYDDTI